MVVANTILPEPNNIERVFELSELKVPVVNVNPAKFNAPCVNVVTPNAVNVTDPDKLVVILGVLIVSVPNVVLELLLILPVPTMFAVKLLKVPLLDNVKPFKFSEVVPGLNAVVPKFNVLNQLPVVNVLTAVPLPVNVILGEVSAVPPVLPNAKVLVTAALDEKLGVPV